MDNESNMKYILESTMRNASENHEAYQQFQLEYHMHLSKRTVKNISILDYIDEYLGMIPELYKITCELHKNKAKEFTKGIHGVA
jgi:hypothetical protein